VVIAFAIREGGVAYMPRSRRVLSRILNVFFRAGSPSGARSLERVSPLSCGRRARVALEGTNFECSRRSSSKAYAAGCDLEIPSRTIRATAAARTHASSAFGLDLLRAFLFAFWKLRNSIESADTTSAHSTA